MTKYLSQPTEIGAEPLRVCLTDKLKIHAYTRIRKLDDPVLKTTVRVNGMCQIDWIIKFPKI